MKIGLPRRAYFISGLVFVFIGLVFLLNSFSGLTGFVILGEIEGGIGSFGFVVGVVFLIGGVAVLMARASRSSGLVRIVKTGRFNKAVKGHDVGRINTTLNKIGTGTGKEERLKGGDHYSIRDTGGGRIIFSYDDPAHTEATAEDYLPAHEYEEWKKRTGN